MPIAILVYVSLMFRFAVPLVLAAAILLSQGQPKSQQQATENTLSAGIAFQEPIYTISEMNRVLTCFALFNHGPSTVNPKVESSHLLINGVEPKNWPFLIKATVERFSRTMPFLNSLPPGGHLRFDCPIAEYFEKPGVYTLRWQGESFRSPDLTVRVVPSFNVP